MTKKRSTRRALALSLISLLLCVSMFVGTTFAWFTDSVSSVNNVITAGNLDVELYYMNDETTDWVKVGENTNIFKEDTLWEPGHTEVVKLKVVNEGTLALKYNLGVNVYSETVGINVAGEVFKLSDYIKYGVVDGAQDYTRDAAIAAVDAKATKLNVNYSGNGELLADKEAFVTMVVYMPTTVGNEANYKTGTNPPVINLGINLFATQYTHEEDSFGPDYDKDAAWTGAVDTTWYNTTDTTFTLTTAEDLAGFAALVNAGNTFAGKTVKLGANVDLNNVNWTPIGTKSAEGEKAFTRTFAGSFDGQGHTISNLRVVGGNALGLFGRTGTGTHIENVNIVNAYVSGTDYVGAIAGYAYLSANCIKNCTVTNATIIATPFLLANGEYDGGAKAGVIVGYALNGNLVGNTAKDSTVFAYRDLGGIAGMLGADGIGDRTLEASGNKVTGVTLNYVSVPGTYTEGKTNGNMAEVVGRLGSKSSVGTNDVSDVTLNTVKAYVLYTVDDLYTFAAAVNGGNTFKGQTVLLGADINLANSEWTPIGNSTNKFQGTFDGNGKTISNLYVNMPGKSNVGLFGMTTDGAVMNLTVENATVTGRLNVGVVAGTPYTSAYSNITVKGHVEVNGMSYVGGVGGKNAYANWTDVTVAVDETSYVNAVSTENGVAYRTYVGGVVGFNGEGGHTFKNITSNIDVIGDVCDIGGVFGIAHYNNKFENITCTGDVTNLISAENDGEDAATDVLETGLIAGVWHNQNDTTVSFTNISATGTISTPNVTPAEAFHNGGLVGKKYSASGTGTLEIVNFYEKDGITYYTDVVTGDNVLYLVPADYANTTVTVPNNVTSMAAGAFAGSPVTSVTIPASVTNFGCYQYSATNAYGSAFKDSAVETIVLAEGMTEIPNAAFSGATNLKSVNIPTTVESIGIWAFRSTAITTLTIPATVEEIGYGAFRDMPNLTTVTIAGDVYVPDYAFRQCANLKTVHLTGTNVSFGSNMIFTTSGTNNENPNGITVYVANPVVKARLEATGQFKGTIVCETVVDENGMWEDADGSKAAYATDATTMSEAINNGATTVYLSSGNYIIPAAAKGKTLTIVGSADTSVAVTKVGTGGENCDYGLDGSTVTFENVTITTNSSTYIGYARLNATYNNCTFNGTYTLYGNSEFNNCTFNVSGDVYNVWTWGAPTATFNDCTFNNDGKALLLYGTANTKLTVNGCTFNDNGGLTDKKAAIEIGNDYGKSYELIVNNTVVNGYEINDKGINTGVTLWGNKNSMGTDKLNVVVDGVDVY